MAKLVVLPCEDYSKEHVSACVDSIFADFGDAEAFLVKGKNIFIKANLVTDLPPERHGTTHPMLVECIARRLVEAGARVVVGDSSGGAYTRAYMNNIYRVTGMTEACKASGAELNDDFGFSTVDLKGKVNRHQEIIDVFLKADAVINVCKLKTHGFTGYSCAVKNLYGLIPGLVKAEVHSKYPELDDFCDNLIDIERFASEKILLHVVDGVIGMEGEGPTNGTPRFVGKIIACDDAYITDVAAVKLFDEPSKMPLLLKAVERGLLNSDFGASCVETGLFRVRKSLYRGFQTRERASRLVQQARLFAQIFAQGVGYKKARNKKVGMQRLRKVFQTLSASGYRNEIRQINAKEESVYPLEAVHTLLLLSGALSFQCGKAEKTVFIQSYARFVGFQKQKNEKTGIKTKELIILD